MVFLKRQVETKNGKEYTNYYFYHGNTYLGKAEDGLSSIQANIKEELGETVEPEKIEKLQEQAREKMEEEVREEDSESFDIDLDLDHWNRAKKRESKNHVAVWEFGKDRDVTVEIVEKDDGQEGKYYDVLEKVGGYTEHEIASAVMGVEKAIEEAERQMRMNTDSKAEMADSEDEDVSVKNSVEASPPEIGDEYYHVGIRDSSEFDEVRVPDWSEEVADDIREGSKVRMGKTGEGEWKVQSVMIEKEGVSREEAKDLAERIAVTFEGSDKEASGSDTDIFAGDEFADKIANDKLIYEDWDEDDVANIDDRSPLEPGDTEEERVNDEILLSEELKNIEELSENHREVYEMLKDEVDIHKGRVKQPESILKKLHEKYSEEVTDIIGVTIMADDKEEVMQVAQELKDRHALYPIGEERADENHYEENGFYRAYHLIIEVEHDGEKYPAEVQIKTEEQAKLHELAHEYYKRNEDMPELLEEKARQLESGEIDSVDVDELKKKLP